MDDILHLDIRELCLSSALSRGVGAVQFPLLLLEKQQQQPPKRQQQKTHNNKNKTRTTHTHKKTYIQGRFSLSLMYEQPSPFGKREFTDENK